MQFSANCFILLLFSLLASLDDTQCSLFVCVLHGSPAGQSLNLSVVMNTLSLYVSHARLLFNLFYLVTTEERAGEA